MLVKAHAKINWTLAVTGKYDNGYHELDMLMQSVSLADTLRIEPSDTLTLTVDGKSDPLGEKNLVMKAARALAERMKQPRGAALFLEKRIPAQAGLGGGSADCAAALWGLNRFWETGLSERELLAIGAKLGADVPFCLTGGLARVKGFGEIVEPLAGAPCAALLLIKPERGLSTPEVYAAYDALPEKTPFDTDRALSDLLAGRYAALQETGRNHLEDAARRLLPEIEETQLLLSSVGALFVRMTGSGSCVYGVFPDAETALAAQKRLPCPSLFAQTLSNGSFDTENNGKD